MGFKMSLLFKSANIGKVDGRKASFVASDESVDRMGDIVRASGWSLDPFRSNPVLLWSHNPSELPIGKVTNIGIRGKQLVADVEFATADQNPFADKVYRLVKAGILKAVSVGFSPIERKQLVSKDGRYTGTEFLKQELHELSVVNVPANANALAIAKNLEMSERDMLKVFQLNVIPDSIKRERDRIHMARVKAQLCAL